MGTTFSSQLHTFSLDDITITFDGLMHADDPTHIDTSSTTMPVFEDKDGNILYGVDNEFGFYVTDFIGAEDKVLDDDFGEGFAGNIIEEGTGTILGLALRNSKTEVFKSGAPFGTWALGLGGATVKASTEHYNTMAAVLSDQAFAGDPDAIGALDNDLQLMDLDQTTLTPGDKHLYYVDELADALQAAMDANDFDTGQTATVFTNATSAFDFDRDGENDAYTQYSALIDYDADGDGTAVPTFVGALDLGNNDVLDAANADVIDGTLNGLGGTADVTDLMAPNESTVTSDIAFSTDYAITVKDDGKLLYRWGTAVKRPNDLRMEVDLDLPEEWTEDLDNNGVADILENGHRGFAVTKAELVITHDITNNPNDQVRPEDYENEAAIGRLPAHYIIEDPDNPGNELWVSPVNSYNGEGKYLPSYLVLDGNGDVLNPAVAPADSTAVYDPNGVRVGYRNDLVDGTIFKDGLLASANASANLDFSSEDIAEGFTDSWYTTVDREPFEWSYDMFSDNPYKNVYESFRTAEDGEAAGYTEDDLASGPRWRLTPNKFGQDLPGLEVPLVPNSQPPFQNNNIKYETGELTTTKLNLLDWDGASPLANSIGWMVVDPERLDENKDGLIDADWHDVVDVDGNTLQSGDALPTTAILSAVSPNGTNLSQNFMDTAVYVKGDRQDATNIYDIQLNIEYTDASIGAVQKVVGLDHNVQEIDFLNNATFASAVVFATPPTLVGSAPASVAIKEVSESGVMAYIDEADMYDGLHLPEDVTLFTLDEGNWTLSDGTRMEVGKEIVGSGATDTMHSIAFDDAFAEAPTVLVQLQTDNGDDWLVVRADNVSQTGFDFVLQEQEASDGVHDAEVVGWMAIDPNSASGLMDWDGLLSQAFNFEDAVNQNDFSVPLDSSLGFDPLVSAAVTSYNGVDPATLRLADITSDAFGASAVFRLQEERSLDIEIMHKPEDISGIAFEGEGMLYGLFTDAFDFV